MYFLLQALTVLGNTLAGASKIDKSGNTRVTLLWSKRRKYFYDRYVFYKLHLKKLFLCCLGPCFSNFYLHRDHLEILLKSDSDSVCLEWGPKFHISNSVIDDALCSCPEGHTLSSKDLELIQCCDYCGTNNNFIINAKMCLIWLLSVNGFWLIHVCVRKRDREKEFKTLRVAKG